MALFKICSNFVESWKGMEKEDHIPLYESMMDLSIRNTTYRHILAPTGQTPPFLLKKVRRECA